MKKSTYEKRAKIANDVMNYIYKYIDTNIKGTSNNQLSRTLF